MTAVTFYRSGGLLAGVSIAGHTGFAPEGEDILCAAISSAAYLTANTVTEVMQVPAEASVAEGENAEFRLLLPESDLIRCQDVLKGLRLHLEGLCEQYPGQIIITEV